MYRFTTPTHRFQLDGINAADVQKIRITYVQGCKTVLEKTEADCTKDGNTVSVKLTQEDTALFRHCDEAQVQMRVRLNDGSVLSTKKFNVSIQDVLSTEVL